MSALHWVVFVLVNDEEREVRKQLPASQKGRSLPFIPVIRRYDEP